MMPQFRSHSEGSGGFKHESSGNKQSQSNSKKRILVITGIDFNARVKGTLTQEHTVEVYSVDKYMWDYLEREKRNDEPFDMIVFTQQDGQTEKFEFVDNARKIDPSIKLIYLDDMANPLTAEAKAALTKSDVAIYPSSFQPSEFLLYTNGVLTKDNTDKPPEKLSEPEPLQVVEGISLSEARKNARVLVVDDEDIVGRMTTRMLTRNGYNPDRIVYTDKRADALKLLQSSEFDLIISDYHMPGMDYLSFREKALKVVEAKYGKSIPILLYSANLLDVKEAGAIADSYFQKADEWSIFLKLADGLISDQKEERR